MDEARRTEIRGELLHFVERKVKERHGKAYPFDPDIPVGLTPRALVEVVLEAFELQWGARKP